MIREQYKRDATDTQKMISLAQEILKNGYVVLDDFLDDVTKERIHTFIKTIKKHNGKGEELRGTPVYELGYSDEILAFSQALYDARCVITGEQTRKLDAQMQVVGMPYKDGRDMKKNDETPYHYDGAYVNLIIPLLVPEDQIRDGGNLVLFPNLRLHHKKLVAKILSRLLRHSAWFRTWFGYKKVIYKVDALHAFFGDLSFHGVEPIVSGERLIITINSHW